MDRCASCGQESESNSPYCLNPTCGALLYQPAPTDSAAAGLPVAAPAAPPSGEPVPAVPVPEYSAPFPAVRGWITSLQDKRPLRLPGLPPLTDRVPPMTRWVPPAVAIIVLSAVIILIAGSSPGGQPIAGPPEPPAATVSWLPWPTPPPTPTPAAAPSQAAPPATPPPANAAPVNPPAGNPAPAQQRTTTRPPAAPAKPPPAPSVDATAYGKCVWEDGRGWTIVVSVSVRNGSGTSATGYHGPDPNVGAETYPLSGGGSSFHGELPPDLGDNPELTGSVVSWRVTVRLSNGATLTDQGSASNPC